MDHDHHLLDQLKYKQAMAMRGDRSYSFARESEYRLATMPMEIDRDLEQRSGVGLIFYGMVDIYNTSFIFICETFDYLVDKSTEIDEYATTEKVECCIDYDSIRTYRYSIKIDEFVKRFYMAPGPLNLQEIISCLCEMTREEAA